MIKGFETASILYPKCNGKTVLPSSVPLQVRNPENKNYKKHIAVCLGGLSALGTFGYAGIRLYKGQSIKSKDINSSIPDFKKFFSEIKQIPSFIYSEQENYKLINNPAAKKCMEVLDNLTPKAKKTFVKEYCNMTGFPSLEALTKNVDSEILSTLNKMVTKGNNKVLFAGYDRNNSFAKNLALPGSDCDGLFVIVEKPLSNCVNRLELGFGVNQRLAETTGAHFPEVFCFDEIKNAIYKAEDIVQNRLNLSSEKLKRYESNLSDNGNDFVKAAEFNIDISNQLNQKYDKEIICLSAFFVEFLRSGKVLLNNVDKGFLDYLKNTKFFKFSNITRQEAFQGVLKPKLEVRKELCKRYEKMNDEERFSICKDLFESSLGLGSGTQKGCFETFDMGNIMDMYKKLRS